MPNSAPDTPRPVYNLLGGRLRACGHSVAVHFWSDVRTSLILFCKAGRSDRRHAELLREL